MATETGFRRVFECPYCARSGRWTDGQDKALGGEVNEYWCQVCGEESPLSDEVAVTLRGTA